MQRQAFREKTDIAPRYDSETVRRVLARASERETQAEPDQLTPEQVEALGAELGLHPDAVRRALSELVPTQTATVTRPAPKLTKTQVNDIFTSAPMVAALNAVIYYQSLSHPDQETLLTRFFFVVAVFVVTPLTTFIYGVAKRDKSQLVKYGFVLNILNTLLIVFTFYLHFYYLHGTIELTYIGSFFIIFGWGIFVSLLAGAFGIFVGDWHEKRKRRLAQ